MLITQTARTINVLEIGFALLVIAISFLEMGINLLVKAINFLEIDFALLVTAISFLEMRINLLAKAINFLGSYVGDTLCGCQTNCAY
jgi:hypothetical protein